MAANASRSSLSDIMWTDLGCASRSSSAAQLCAPAAAGFRCSRERDGARDIAIHPIGVAALLEPFVAARSELDSRGALLAGLLVTLQRAGNARRIDAAQRPPEHDRILNRHAGALRHEW